MVWALASRLHRYAAALREYTAATTIDPTHADAYNNLGNVHRATGHRAD
jgi:tetratricopeptide (TPR) repeat protein